MAGSVLWETLRREVRGALLWSMGLALFGIISVLVLPDQAGMEQLVDGLNAVPQFLWQLLGIDDLAVLATPAGFIGLRYFLTAAVLVAAWGVIAGLNVTVNDEVSGTSNMVLSLPVARARLVAERLLAYVPLALLIPLGGMVGLVVGMALNPNGQTDLGPLLNASLVLVPVSLLILCLTAAIGAFIPARALAGGIAGAFVAASFLLKSVANVARSDFGNTMAQLSVFEHADALKTIRDGIAIVPTLTMVIIAVGLALIAVRRFQSRDLTG